MQIEIRNLGTVPSFKNRKRVAGKRVVTDPEVQHWMELCIQSITLQLNCEFQKRLARNAKTQQTKLTPSWIASLVPLDDSIDWVPTLTITTKFVPEEDEGALLTITKL